MGDPGNLTERWRADLDATADELAASKWGRIDVLLACELFVERCAAAGDVDAGKLARLAADSRRRSQVAAFEALVLLPTYNKENQR